MFIGLRIIQSGISTTKYCLYCLVQVTKIHLIGCIYSVQHSTKYDKLDAQAMAVTHCRSRGLSVPTPFHPEDMVKTV